MPLSGWRTIGIISLACRIFVLIRFVLVPASGRPDDEHRAHHRAVEVRLRRGRCARGFPADLVHGPTGRQCGRGRAGDHGMLRTRRG